LTTTNLTKTLIEHAFDLMGEIAAKEGIVLEIAVFGGSCLILASDIRAASGDVDSIFLSNRSAVTNIADTVARQLKMPQNWLNEAVKRLAPPAGNPPPQLFPFGDYPRNVNTGVGLRVHLPTPEYMLAMKILAYRADDDLGKIQTDQNDAVALMKITKLTTRDSLIALMTECYPRLPGLQVGTQLNPRITAKLETLLDAYAESRDTPPPPWNAQRGRPVSGQER
jgi:hypothetical protein